MKIAIHDADQTGFPNYALMKISRYHKNLGDKVEWWFPLAEYDKVYSSKVFIFTSNDDYLPKTTIMGGTGYDVSSKLPDEIEKMDLDYSLYPNLDYRMGFLTRGCIRNCSFCLVRRKEGYIKSYMSIEQIAIKGNIVLMDNNVLACEHGLKEIGKAGRMDIKIDFNQGLDARLIDDNIAQLLAECKWYKPIRLACDSQGQKKYITKSVKLLRKHNATPKTYIAYCLIKDVDEALDRIEFCRDLGMDPFAQPYRDFKGTEPTKEQRRLARWVNHKAIFKTVKWKDYK